VQNKTSQTRLQTHQDQRQEAKGTKTANQAIRYRINQEIKFLYCKKQHINQKLYNIHLECTQQCNGMWQYVQHNMDSKLNADMDLLYKKLN